MTKEYKIQKLENEAREVDAVILQDSNSKTITSEIRYPNTSISLTLSSESQCGSSSLDSGNMSEVKDTKIAISSLESSVSQPVTKSVDDGKIKDTTNIVKQEERDLLKNTSFFSDIRDTKTAVPSSVPSNSYCSAKIMDDEKRKSTTSMAKKNMQASKTLKGSKKVTLTSRGENDKRSSNNPTSIIPPYQNHHPSSGKRTPFTTAYIPSYQSRIHQSGSDYSTSHSQYSQHPSYYGHDGVCNNQTRYHHSRPHPPHYDHRHLGANDHLSIQYNSTGQSRPVHPPLGPTSQVNVILHPSLAYRQPPVYHRPQGAFPSRQTYQSFRGGPPHVSQQCGTLHKPPPQHSFHGPPAPLRCAKQTSDQYNSRNSLSVSITLERPTRRKRDLYELSQDQLKKFPENNPSSIITDKLICDSPLRRECLREINFDELSMTSDEKASYGDNERSEDRKRRKQFIGLNKLSIEEVHSASDNILLSSKLSNSPMFDHDHSVNTPLSKKQKQTLFRSVTEDTGEVEQNNIRDEKTPASRSKFSLFIDDIKTPLFSRTEMTKESFSIAHHFQEQSFTPLPHTSCSSSVKNQCCSDSAVFDPAMIEIAPQLTWSISKDTPSAEITDLDSENKNKKDNSSTSIFNNISPMFWSPEAGSCSPFQEKKHEQPNFRENAAEKFDNHREGCSPKFNSISPNSIDDVFLEGETTPLPNFFDQTHSKKDEDKENHIPFDRNRIIIRHQSTNKFQQSRDKNTKKRIKNVFVESLASEDNKVLKKSSLSSLSCNQLNTSSSYSHDTAQESSYDTHIKRADGSLIHQPSRNTSIPCPKIHNGIPSSPQRNNVHVLRGLTRPRSTYHVAHASCYHQNQPPLQHNVASPMTTTNRSQQPFPWRPQQHIPYRCITQREQKISKRKCVPLKQPIPSKFQGNLEKIINIPVPDFTNLVNFPAHMTKKNEINLPSGIRCCVMCGLGFPCSGGNKNKKKQDPLKSSTTGHNGASIIIPSQNKGLCTNCDVNVWVITQTGFQIKWCKGCKNFRTWAAFGEKGLATKCMRCRERQREKYALLKDEKVKTKESLKTDFRLMQQ